MVFRLSTINAHETLKGEITIMFSFDSVSAVYIVIVLMILLCDNCAFVQCNKVFLYKLFFLPLFYICTVAMLYYQFW